MSSVTVFCALRSGIVLTIAHPTDIARATHFEMREGSNEVDADFWAEWTKQNADYGPYKAGLLTTHPEEPEAAPVASQDRVKATPIKPKDA